MAFLAQAQAAAHQSKLSEANAKNQALLRENAHLQAQCTNTARSEKEMQARARLALLPCFVSQSWVSSAKHACLSLAVPVT